MKRLLSLNVFMGILSLGLLFSSVTMDAQTNPAAFSLAGGNFSFTSQTATSTTYPANMQGWGTGVSNLAVETAAASNANLALFASGNGSTFGLSNLGASGFQFRSSGSENFVGEVALALNSTGRNNILVTWIAEDYTAAAGKATNLLLQYRVGTTGTFTTVPNTLYTTSATNQKAPQTFTNVVLPSGCDNQAVVQLRWLYFESTGSGARDGIRLDDITIASTAIPTGGTVDGVIAANEYGVHTNGSNQQTSGTPTTYINYDATNLYIGVSAANIAEGFVMYLDKNPTLLVNGGTNADGSLAGNAYDGTNFAELPFRADYVLYMKNGYRELRAANGTNGWGTATVSIGTYADNAGTNTREISIPWSSIGGQPSAFNFFTYVTAASGFVYAQTPTENQGGTIGTSARYSRYYTVVSTAAPATNLPFAKNSYTFNSATDINAFGTITAYDFTMNTVGRFISRSGNTAGDWNIAGNLRVGAGTIYLGSGAGTYGATNISGNLNLQGGTFDMDATTGAVTVGAKVIITSSATLKLSSQVGGDLNAKGDWTNNGTFLPNGRTVKFNGAAAQLLTGATTFDYFRINNATGLTLASPVTVNTQAELLLGKVTLGTNSFTMGSAATFISQNANSYLVINGTGKLIRNAFGTGAKPFPVGLAASYTPLTISNTGIVSTLTLGVTAPPTNVVNDATKIVNLQWDLNSTTAGAVADITFNWNVADQASAFSATGQGELGNYTTGPLYAITNIGTLSGQSKAVTGVALSTGSNKLVIGNTGAVQAAPPANDECVNAIALVNNANPISGTVKNATASLSTSPCAQGTAVNDVWYSFTTTAAGDYNVIVNGGTGFDAVVNIRTGACNGTSLICQDNTNAGQNENVLIAGATASTTYLIRVREFSNLAATPTFTIKVTSPALSFTATPVALTFASTAVMTATASQTTSITGTSFTTATGTITATAPNANFQVSADNTTFGPTATFAYTNYGLASTPVYVKYTPQTTGAATGNLVFTGGGITATNVALNGTAVIGTPIANLPTNITPTSFDANWTAVTGASDYLLDVSTSSTFGTTTPTTETQNFSTAPVGWTQVGLGTYPGGGNIALRFDDTGDQLVTSTFSGSATELSFKILGNGTNAASSLLVEGFNGVNWVPVQTIVPIPTSPSTGTIITYNSTSAVVLPANLVQFRFTYTKSAGNLAFDDFSLKYNAFVGNFVTGYNAKPVGNVTTAPVTGLTPFTNYYFRVRAKDASTTSDYSNIQALRTLPESIIWNGTSWSNTVGPDLTKRALIQGVYNTATNGAFEAYSVAIQSGSLTVATGTNLKVQQEITNALTAADFVIENDANLVQVDNEVNFAPATVKRNSAAIMRQDYTLWSSPVEGQTLQSFSPGTLVNRFYTYSPSTDLYVQVANPATTEFDVTKGYLIRTSNTHPTVPTIVNGAFTGTNLHNGTYNMATVTGTFNAIGNPYPSAMSADAFINVNNLQDPLYFWRKTNNATTTSYATYTLAGGTGTSSNPGDPNNLVPNGIINVGQGFIVKATSSLHLFSNAMRRANNNGQFLRNNDVERNRIWVNLTNTSGIFSQTMVSYMTGATAGVDNAIDGKYFNDSQTALTTIIDGGEYAIQGRSLPFVSSDVVPMGFKVVAAGDYAIGLDHFDGLFEDASVSILLRDNLTGAVTDLRAGNYTFASAPGVFNTRFDIIYQTPLKTNVPTLDANSIVVYKSNGSFVINTGINTMAEVAVYDVQGRLLAGKKKVNATETTMDAINTNQVLLIEVTMDNGAKATKKVVN